MKERTWRKQWKENDDSEETDNGQYNWTMTNMFNNEMKRDDEKWQYWLTKKQWNEPEEEERMDENYDERRSVSQCQPMTCAWTNIGRKKWRKPWNGWPMINDQWRPAEADGQPTNWWKMTDDIQYNERRKPEEEEIWQMMNSWMI